MNAPDSPADSKKILIRVPLTVRWGDMDAFGHVNNVRYMGYLEEARVQWLQALPGALEGSILPVIAAAHLDYRHPIQWPNELQVELFVESLSNSSITIGHRILSASDLTLHCDGHIVAVWMNVETGRSAPIPDFIRNACQSG